MRNDNEDDEVWPPIHVRGEILSLDEISQTQGTLYHSSIPSEQRTMVKWFPGVKMYEALSTAARFGMEKVVKLLLSAGNEVRFLERNVSLSKLMSKAKIS